MSKEHDNKKGKKELKYVHPDGREAVFNGDTGEPMLDPKYKATYNYTTPVPWPKNIGEVGEYANKSIWGHGIKDDYLIYIILGKRNERSQEYRFFWES